MAYDDQQEPRHGEDLNGPASGSFRPAETPEQQYAQPRWAEARTGNVPTDTRESGRGRWLFAGAVALVALAVGVAAGAVLPERGDTTFSLPASAKIEAFDEEIVQAVYDRFGLRGGPDRGHPETARDIPLLSARARIGVPH